MKLLGACGINAGKISPMGFTGIVLNPGVVNYSQLEVITHLWFANYCEHLLQKRRGGKAGGCFSCHASHLKMRGSKKL